MRRIDPELRGVAADLQGCVLSEVNTKPGYLELLFMGPAYRVYLELRPQDS